LADQSHSDYHRGDMDIHEQAATYAAVYGMIKWCSLALAASLTWVVMWFCTPAGPFAGLVVGAIIAIIGVVVLRSKPDQGH
jgi:Bacterial aa3 type cytochrome c oxidase subunit IV